MIVVELSPRAFNPWVSESNCCRWEPYWAAVCLRAFWAFLSIIFALKISFCALGMACVVAGFDVGTSHVHQTGTRTLSINLGQLKLPWASLTYLAWALYTSCVHWVSWQPYCFHYSLRLASLQFL